jgi:starvation-inducible DNA-binding protein
MSDLTEDLKSLQANVVAMYAQAHGYHWNVKGMLFKQLHAFFLEIYEDVYDSIDTISENIRKLGDDAPFGLKTWSNSQTVSVKENPNLSPVDMLIELTSVNMVIINQLKAIFRSANASDEQGLANFIAERIDKHQFWNWQLRATLESVVV